jgi:predicted nucleic acid-binding protein
MKIVIDANIIFSLLISQNSNLREFIKEREYKFYGTYILSAKKSFLSQTGKKHMNYAKKSMKKILRLLLYH